MPSSMEIWASASRRRAGPSRKDASRSSLPTGAVRAMPPAAPWRSPRGCRPGSFEITIRDDGKGFDWRTLPEVEPENLLAFNGRGIFLTKIYFDEVIYNDSGNQVTLRKTPPSAGRRLIPRRSAQMKLSVSRYAAIWIALSRNPAFFFLITTCSMA